MTINEILSDNEVIKYCKKMSNQLSDKSDALMLTVGLPVCIQAINMMALDNKTPTLVRVKAMIVMGSILHINQLQDIANADCVVRYINNSKASSIAKDLINSYTNDL